MADAACGLQNVHNTSFGELHVNEDDADSIIVRVEPPTVRSVSRVDSEFGLEVPRMVNATLIGLHASYDPESFSETKELRRCAYADPEFLEATIEILGKRSGSGGRLPRQDGDTDESQESNPGGSEDLSTLSASSQASADSSDTRSMDSDIEAAAAGACRNESTAAEVGVTPSRTATASSWFPRLRSPTVCTPLCGWLHAFARIEPPASLVFAGAATMAALVWWHQLFSEWDAASTPH
eukprot:TRINITY_DN105067_c0_g1_i1.p1 TRINITY_DN105067_c0_g1~~TRINITY_DN105067_c0_g1_i1.p1  ORF type:complete len:238 (+),score=44.79 TRINITY_DN105067_c0_g1_i1:81-794(+)